MAFLMFRPKLLAWLVAGLPLVSHAAIYSIERVDDAQGGQVAKGTAISADGARVGVEVVKGSVGLDFSEQLPFMIDTTHTLVDWNDVDNYCINYLGYNTCDMWTNEYWYGSRPNGEVCESIDSSCYGGYAKQLDAWTAGYTSNRIASVRAGETNTRVNPFATGIVGTPPAGTLETDSTNVVIQGFSSTNLPIGASSSPYFSSGTRDAQAFQRRGFVGTTELLPPASASELIRTLGQTNAYGSLNLGATGIVYGSASVANIANPANSNKSPDSTGVNLAACVEPVNYNERACQYLQFANQAAIWLNNGTSQNAIPVVANFPSGTTGYTDQTAQAAIRSAVVETGKTAPTLVGFNTYNDNNFYATAVTLKSKVDDLTCLNQLATNPAQECWDMALIPGLAPRHDGDLIYTYSVATDINANGIVIGEAKNANPVNGGYPENLFVYDVNGSSLATLIGAGQSELFFNGYNATAAAINNDNEIVGKIDVENAQDRQRRQRGYIYLHGSAPHLGDFDNTRAWILDDLTNDGVVSGSGVANEFRVAEAFDINENGDIAGSAYYCAGGYQTLAKDAYCDGVEEVVAVKLTRLPTGNIEPRSNEISGIERGGAGFGLFGFSLLFLSLIYRRQIKQ